MHPAHKYTEIGNYTACLSVENKYGKYTFCSQVNVEFIEGVDENILFPNPTFSDMTLYLTGTELAHIEIYNSLGLIVKKIESSDKKVQIEINGQSPGVYFLRISTESYKQKVIKFIKR
jgi:type IX secretion system substrate protein